MINKILLFMLLSSTLWAKAQNDSIEVSESKFIKAYNYFTMANHQETSVWKFKILPISPVDELRYIHKTRLTYEGPPIIISYEKKIKNNISIQVDSKSIIWGVDKKTFFSLDTFQNSLGPPTITKNYYESARTIFNSSVGIELRYYYNMKRRMHRRHTASNFSGNYFAGRINRNLLQIGTDYRKTVNQFESDATDQASHPFFDNTFSVLYGIQRRFLKYFFFDIRIGAAFRYGSEKIRPYTFYTSLDPNGEVYSYTEKAQRIILATNFRIGFAF